MVILIFDQSMKMKDYFFIFLCSIPFHPLMFCNFHQQLFTSFVKAVPKYWNFWDCETDLASSFWAMGLLMYIKAIDFCLLIWHSSTLLKSSIIYNSFTLKSFVSPLYKIMLSANSDDSLFVSLIIFSCLMTQVKILFSHL